MEFREELIQKVPGALVAQIELPNQNQLDLFGRELLVARFLIAFLRLRSYRYDFWAVGIRKNISDFRVNCTFGLLQS